MSQFQLSPSQMDALLAMAGKKMGEQISALIQNPQAMEQFIQNPKVQQLLQGLMGR